METEHVSNPGEIKRQPDRNQTATEPQPDRDTASMNNNSPTASTSAVNVLQPSIKALLLTVVFT